MKKTILIFFTFLLASCGHEPVGREFEFDDSKDYALLAYDMSFISGTWPNYSFYLFPYNEEDGTINRKKRAELGCGYLCEKGNEEVRFAMKPVKPGTYVLGYFYYRFWWNPTVICYPSKTIKLEIKPGTIHYLGEMVIKATYGEGVHLDEFQVLEHGEDHVRARLAKFPNVLEVPTHRPDGTRLARKPGNPGKIVTPPAEYVSFIRPEGFKENECIRGYAN